jgi:hypothetical protein
VTYMTRSMHLDIRKKGMKKEAKDKSQWDYQSYSIISSGLDVEESNEQNADVHDSLIQLV